MSDNLKIWDAVKQPPPDALKNIGGGRLKGMTDVNPQWRYQTMTEQFGVCGVGWKYVIARTWTEAAPEGQIMVFAEIHLFVREGEEWSDAIPATGGSFLVEKETKGLHANDEGYKMAITDALGTAMKMLGVAADVYRGKWDGAKYKGETTSLPPTEPLPTGKKTQNFEFLKVMAKQKERVGDGAYYKILGGNGFEHANEIMDRTSQETIFKILLDLPDKKEA